MHCDNILLGVWILFLQKILSFCFGRKLFVDKFQPFEASLKSFWGGSREPFYFLIRYLFLNVSVLEPLILLKIIEDPIEILFIRVLLIECLPFWILTGIFFFN